MRDESWNFLSTFLENLSIEVLFNADFDGVVQIVDFRHAITIKNHNLSFCTCLYKYMSFLAFSVIFWGFWPIKHLPPIRKPARARAILRFCMFCFACASPVRHIECASGAASRHCCVWGHMTAARGGRRVQWSAVSRTAAREQGARYGCIGNETPAITRARGDKETYKGPIDERRFKVR